MSGNVKYRNRRREPIRFSVSPLTVYDTDEWDPLSGLDDVETTWDPLDLDYIEGLGERTSKLLTEYGIPTLPTRHDRVEGEEVGDDRIDLSLDPRRLACALVCQESVCGMVTSWEDTFLSTGLWNFCETTGPVPLHPGQSFDRCRKVGEFDDLGFVDSPPLRILLDVSKGDMSHSSTPVGKVAMLASRMRTPRTEFLRDWHLASYLQDGYLRTSRCTDPKYLHQVMGGSGARALFSNPVNLYLYVHAYRAGICQRIYGSATRELRQSLDSMIKSEVSMPILCRRLRDRQDYLHGTYAEKIFVPAKEWSDTFAAKLPPPLVRQTGGANYYAAFEQRLARTRHVVTRSEAERGWENTSRIRAKLLSRYQTTTAVEERERFEAKRSRSEFGDALMANVAFSNLLERKGSIQDVIALTTDNFHVVNCGTTGFSRWDAEWLFLGGKAEGFSIDDLAFCEDLYLRKEVCEDESMRVGSIPLRPVTLKGKTVLTTTTVGMYQIGSGMFEWAADLAARLEARRDAVGRPLSPEDALQEYQRDPEWVNDDTLIIARCLRDTATLPKTTVEVVLISADKRLGNQLANSCNVAVYRVDPRDYIAWYVGQSITPANAADLMVVRSYLDTRGRRMNPLFMYIDTGSLNSFLARVDPVEGRTLTVRRTTSSARLPGGRRSVSYTLIHLDCPSSLGYFYHAPIRPSRRFRSSETASSETRSRRSRIASHDLSSTRWREGM